MPCLLSGVIPAFPTLLQIQFYFYCNAEIFNLIVCQNLRRRSLCQKKSECNCDVFSYHVAQCCFVCGPKKQFSKLGKDCKDLYRNTYVGLFYCLVKMEVIICFLRGTANHYEYLVNTYCLISIACVTCNTVIMGKSAIALL